MLCLPGMLCALDSAVLEILGYNAMVPGFSTDLASHSGLSLPLASLLSPPNLTILICETEINASTHH